MTENRPYEVAKHAVALPVNDRDLSPESRREALDLFGVSEDDLARLAAYGRTGKVPA